MRIDTSEAYSTCQKLFRVEYASTRYGEYIYLPIDTYAYTTKAEAIEAYNAEPKVDAYGEPFAKAWRLAESGYRKSTKRGYKKYHELA